MFLNTYWIEIVGYSGSFLVALSLSMKSISRLRQINLIGASTFALYGLLVQAYPVLVLNSFISAVDIYYLLQMRRKKDYFELLPIPSTDSPFLQRFLKYHSTDIKTFFPDFKFEPQKDYLIILVLRNLLPVSLFMAEKTDQNRLQICLDYSIPAYRDLQNAHYLFHHDQNIFKEQNFRFFVTHSAVPAHQKYLQKLGFVQDPEQDQHWFIKEISK